MGISFLGQALIALIGRPRAVRFHEWLLGFLSDFHFLNAGIWIHDFIFPKSPTLRGYELVEVAKRAFHRGHTAASVSLAKHAIENLELTPRLRVRALVAIYRAGVFSGNHKDAEYVRKGLGIRIDVLVAKVGISEFLGGAKWGPEIKLPFSVYFKALEDKRRRAYSIGLHNFQLNNASALEERGVNLDPLVHINFMRGDQVDTRLQIKQGSSVLIDNLEVVGAGSKVPAPAVLNPHPVVSVIMPVFNASSTIRYSIQSILNQTLTDFELLIVDDGSDDDSVAVAKQMAAQDPRIKVFQSARNSGAYAARNYGISRAKGEFVTVQDADDWSFPERLEVQLEVVRDTLGALGSYSDQLRVSRDLRILSQNPAPRPTSLLFSRETVLSKAGYFDQEKVGCDSEFLERLGIIFGKSRIIHTNKYPLTLALSTDSSLTTNSELGLHQGFAPGGFRSFYRDAYRKLHSDKNLSSEVFPLSRDRSLGLMENFGTTVKKSYPDNPGLLINFTSSKLDFQSIVDLIPKNGQLEVAHNMCVFGSKRRTSAVVQSLLSLPGVTVSSLERVKSLKVVSEVPCSGAIRGYGVVVTKHCPCRKV